ncbi:hypothetical protein CVO76_01405 [Arthrobacter agilis]|uniref:Uncharacterized protein n=1 Tax=Arthrobacter agilis TaxID=37921 RepID=A0A2L0UB27_9MICC|nr:hypothetical protein [Arthrobacter agilis]AUZ86451.1 hypothetical protein CVO76_01405 [Arthrobacter agilis]
MSTGMSEEEQQRRTCAAFRSTSLSTYDLWLRYFSLGGNVGEEEIDAYLYSSLLLPPVPAGHAGTRRQRVHRGPAAGPAGHVQRDGPVLTSVT